MLVQAAIAFFEVNSEARSDALEARLLATLFALLASQHHSRHLLQPDSALLTAAGSARSASANLAVVYSSGSDVSFTEDEYSEHEDSLATADPQSCVPVSPPSSSSSYATLVNRIRQEYRSDGTVPVTISHITYALVTEGVLLAKRSWAASTKSGFVSPVSPTRARPTPCSSPSWSKAPATPPPVPLL